METLTKSSDSILFSQTFLKAWTLHLKRFGSLIEELDDKTLARQTAPQRNTGIYLLGHLVAVHDGMYSLLGFGQRLYPEYDAMFLKAPDSRDAIYPPVATLREQWTAVNDRLTARLESMAPHEWLGRHSAVSEADFEKEPNRNRFNVLITRLTHLNYHWGQLVYLKENSVEN